MGRFVRAFSAAIKWVLALSLLFELWVAIFIREPLLPNFPDFDAEGSIADGVLLVASLLFDGGPIEGIVASRNLLGMVALLGLIVFGVLLAAGSMRRGWGITWLVVAGLDVRADAFRDDHPRRRHRTRRPRVRAVDAAGRARPSPRRLPDGSGVLVASVTLLAVFWNSLLELFGKGEDLTGRLDIWNAVIGLATERPWAGWGWVGYWNPFVEPFDDLAVRKGVVYLQAHNAWLDVWMQLGIIGLLAFTAIVVGALWRSWFLSVDRPVDAAGRALPYSAAAPAAATGARRPHRAEPRREPHPRRERMGAAHRDRLGDEATAVGARAPAAAPPAGRAALGRPTPERAASDAATGDEAR